MLNELPEPLIGQIVEVLKGRETGQYAIIIGVLNERFVLLADGDKRKYDQPKKKNLQHIRFTGGFAMEVFTSIQESGRVTNSKLRFCLNRFESQQNPDIVSEKGSEHHGER
ncbi:RNA-binding protein [Effusibacillus consociatus]|uniref:RNA-binding protein n=1 Tax=Effusibacillus consociatus TaxID=1117041 RepID=A0ABV9PUL5_9BACL